MALLALTLWLAGAASAVAQPFAFHAISVGLQGMPRGIVAADFDGDGHLDFATANLGSSPRDVSVWHGDGHGNFDGPEFYAVGHGPFSIAAGDVNHDGHPDLAVAVADDHKIAILLWTPSGFVVSTDVEFSQMSSEEPGGGNPRDVVIADFNRDGNPTWRTPCMRTASATSRWVAARPALGIICRRSRQQRPSRPDGRRRR